MFPKYNFLCCYIMRWYILDYLWFTPLQRYLFTYTCFYLDKSSPIKMYTFPIFLKLRDKFVVVQYLGSMLRTFFFAVLRSTFHTIFLPVYVPPTLRLDIFLAISAQADRHQCVDELMKSKSPGTTHTFKISL